MLSNKACRQCGLPEKMLNQYKRQPIELNEAGICVYCQNYNEFHDIYRYDYETPKRQFEELVERIRGKGKYDAVVTFTGGKDSCYSAFLLAKKYGLKVLAVTWDNGFFGEQHFKNLKTFPENLGIDHKIITIDPDVRADFYRNRLDVYGRFCGCVPPAFLFCAPEINDSGASIIILSGSFGQTISLFQQKVLFGVSPEERESYIKENLPKQAQRQVGEEAFLLMILHEIVVGEYSKKAIDLFSKCLAAWNDLRRKDAFIVIPSLFFPWNTSIIIQEISKYGWAVPPKTDASAHTSCTMELMKGYIAGCQNMPDIDIYELTARRRFGEISKEDFDKLFPCLGYSEKEPENIDDLLCAACLTRGKFNKILERKPFAQAMPAINPEIVRQLPIEMSVEELQKKLNIAHELGIRC